MNTQGIDAEWISRQSIDAQ